MKKIRKQRSGFTIIELLIATTVFSGILIIVVYAIIYISASFMKGSIDAQTQQTARSILQQVSQDIQLNDANVTYSTDYGTGNNGYICVGNDQYLYNLNTPVGSGGHALVLISGTSCNALATIPTGNLPSGETELLGDHMVLGNFRVDPSTTSDVYSLQITIGYDGSSSIKTTDSSGASVDTPSSVVDPPYSYNCQGSIVNMDFCSVANLSTAVQKRVTNGELH